MTQEEALEAIANARDFNELVSVFNNVRMTPVVVKKAFEAAGADVKSSMHLLRVLNASKSADKSKIYLHVKEECLLGLALLTGLTERDVIKSCPFAVIHEDPELLTDKVYMDAFFHEYIYCSMKDLLHRKIGAVEKYIGSMNEKQKIFFYNKIFYSFINEYSRGEQTRIFAKYMCFLKRESSAVVGAVTKDLIYHHLNDKVSFFLSFVLNQQHTEFLIADIDNALQKDKSDVIIQNNTFNIFSKTWVCTFCKFILSISNKFTMPSLHYAIGDKHVDNDRKIPEIAWVAKAQREVLLIVQKYTSFMSRDVNLACVLRFLYSKDEEYRNEIMNEAANIKYICGSLLSKS